MAVMLEQPVIPPRKRWTRDEYRRLQEAGFLQGRYELIDGEIRETMTKNPPHCIALALLAVWLESLFGRLFVRTQDPIVLPVPDDNSTEPDVAVTVAPTISYQSDHPDPQDLLLVAEVSDSTLDYGLTTKARLYAAAGIADYWVLNVSARQLTVHRQPSAEGYREVHTYRETEEISPLSRPEAMVAVSSLLPSAPSA